MPRRYLPIRVNKQFGEQQLVVIAEGWYYKPQATKVTTISATSSSNGLFAYRIGQPKDLSWIVQVFGTVTYSVRYHEVPELQWDLTEDLTLLVGESDYQFTLPTRAKRG
jgi:hypothetical protein